MHYLRPFDYGIMAVYVAILVGLGLYLSRRASTSLDHYFLGGKSLPWWALGISGMASFLDMTGTMLIVSFLYALGPRGFYIEFRGGAVLILTVMLVWTGKWHRRSNCMTGAEWMVYRFGEGVGGQFARIVSAVSAFVFTLGALAYLIKGAGLFLTMFIPLSPFQCSLLLIVVGTLYTISSGFYGVVFADMFQSIIILAGVVVVCVMAVTAMAGHPGDLVALAEKITGTPNWSSSWPGWKPAMPPGERYTAYRYLAMSAFFFLLRSILGGMGCGADPKYFGARNERECGLLTFFWTNLMTFRWPMMMGLAVLGLFTVQRLFPDQAVLTEAAAVVRQHLGDVPATQWEDRLSDVINVPAKYPELGAALQGLLGAEWPNKLHLLGYDGRVNPERILPAVLLFSVPAGARGLLIIALIAAAVTTFASYLITTMPFFTKDLYQRYVRPTAGNRELLMSSYVFGLALVGGSVWMAWTTTSINDIWGWLTMGLGTGMAIPGMLKFYWWRYNSGGVNFGAVVGLVSAIVQRAVWPGLPEWKAFLFLTAISLSAAVVATYLSPPNDPKVLEHFYRTTRPFGFWGPLKKKLDPELRAAMTREHRHDLLALPFTVIWQITLFLLPMQLMIGEFRSFCITLPIFGVGLAGMYVFWYRNLPPKACPETVTP